MDNLLETLQHLNHLIGKNIGNKAKCCLLEKEKSKVIRQIQKRESKSVNKK
jgi:hypothetical protein